MSNDTRIQNTPVQVLPVCVFKKYEQDLNGYVKKWTSFVVIRYTGIRIEFFVVNVKDDNSAFTEDKKDLVVLLTPCD